MITVQIFVVQTVREKMSKRLVNFDPKGEGHF